MKYTAKYLPIDSPWTEGCTLINQIGENLQWDGVELGWNKECWRVAELFLVSFEFNTMKIVGRPSPETAKWLKPGMKVKACDCALYCREDNGAYTKLTEYAIRAHLTAINSSSAKFANFSTRVRVLCPTCQTLH